MDQNKDLVANKDMNKQYSAAVEIIDRAYCGVTDFESEEAQKAMHFVLNLINEGKICAIETLQHSNNMQMLSHSDNTEMLPHKHNFTAPQAVVTYRTNITVKQAILLYFKSTKSIYQSRGVDKIPVKFPADTDNNNVQSFLANNIRVVPGAVIREFCYIAPNVIVMPAFVNIGAYIGQNTMIDTFATVGSCAQIGKNCHISGGTGIGGVLEPMQAMPVIIEDDVFIGARSEIVEGVRIGRGSVISMGVFIGQSTKILYRNADKSLNPEAIYGYVPPFSVVVAGSYQGLYCAVIIKQVDERVRSKTSINELLRA